jgi:large conductance mechanosensitive channel
MKELKKEFFEFITSYGVIGVAIGIVMGQAVAKLVTVIVEGLVMPVLEVVLPGNKWQEAVLLIGRIHIKLGLIIAAFIDFFVISAVVFFLVRYILKIETPKK